MEKSAIRRGTKLQQIWGGCILYPLERKEKEKRKICGERKYIFVEKKEKEKTIYFAEENNNGVGTV